MIIIIISENNHNNTNKALMTTVETLVSAWTCTSCVCISELVVSSTTKIRQINNAYTTGLTQQISQTKPN